MVQGIFLKKIGGFDVEWLKVDTQRKRTESVPKRGLVRDEEDSGGDGKWRNLSR